jgi:hypothetical protein
MELAVPAEYFRSIHRCGAVFFRVFRKIRTERRRGNIFLPRVSGGA